MSDAIARLQANAMSIGWTAPEDLALLADPLQWEYLAAGVAPAESARMARARRDLDAATRYVPPMAW